MLIIVSGIITVAAAIQWILIRQISWRVVRVGLQVPILVMTFFGAWFAGVVWEQQQAIEAATAAEARILETMTVQRGDLVVTVNATGTITPDRQVPLAFQLPGVPVQSILKREGERVAQGDVIAILGADNLEFAADEARLALDLQQDAFNALTTNPRDADIEAAEAALTAAQAQFNAAVQTAPDEADEEIARLQSEIARNQLWQGQLQRDSIPDPARLTNPLPGSVDIDLPDGSVTLPDGTIVDPPDEVTLGVPSQVNDAIDNQLQVLNVQNDWQTANQRLNAETVVQQLGYGVEIADLQYESVLGRNADAGSVASANAQRIQAQIALDRLIDGPTEVDLQRASINLEQAELVFEQAQVSLREAQLIAPFDGILAQNNLTVGELPPQNAAAILIDDSGYYVDLPIDETDIVDVQIGQEVAFEVDALPDAELTGTVTRIAYAPVEVAQLVAYNTRVQLNVDSIPVRVGMTVTGQVIVQERLDVLLVRNNFIRFDRITGDAFVFVRLPSGTVEERMVLLGERNDTFSEVRSGLSAGDELALIPREDNNGGGLFGGESE